MKIFEKVSYNDTVIPQYQQRVCTKKIVSENLPSINICENKAKIKSPIEIENTILVSPKRESTRKKKPVKNNKKNKSPVILPVILPDTNNTQTKSNSNVKEDNSLYLNLSTPKNLSKNKENYKDRLYEVVWYEKCNWPCLIVDVKDCPEKFQIEFKNDKSNNKIPIRYFNDENIESALYIYIYIYL